MDRTRFDHLARALAARLDRRTAAAALFGLTAALPGAAASAKSRPPRCRATGAACSSNTQCCSGVCPTGRGTPIARRNRCACRPGFVACGRACVDTDFDASNCGACGTVCRGHSSCDKGVCVASACGDVVCPMMDGMACCNDECHDTTSDDDHCGACNAPCATNESCRHGVCIRTSPCDDVICPAIAGMACCDGACRNVLEDAGHCGGCDRACPDGQSCVRGACTRVDACDDIMCATEAGTTCCDGACRNLLTDPAHCGACSRACSGSRICRDGSCILPA